MKKGFTLIELLIYSAIVAVVLGSSFSFAWTIISNNIKSASLREVRHNAWFAMEKMSQAIEAGQSPSIFTVDSGILYQNGLPLTTDNVRVADLQFTLISNTYRINLNVEYYNPGGRNEYKASLNLESTASPRL